MSDAALEVLTEDECLAMLQRTKYGRVAVVNDQGRPEIFPVNFVLHGRTVAFATGSEVLATRAPLGHVAFEADIIDPTTREGWDVVVAGEGADITDAVDLASLQTRSEPVEHWAPGIKDHWISIVNPHFTGRRLYKPVPSSTFY
jgi:nitroimidazol reductase NimA-like FMN-containing flavoprotein (pyridoxamine 5'-phosphate oxidase superfamily)